MSVLPCPFPVLSHTHPHSICWGCVLPLGDAHFPVRSFKRAVTCGQAHIRPALMSSSDTAPRDLLFEKDTSGGYTGAWSLPPVLLTSEPNGHEHREVQTLHLRGRPSFHQRDAPIGKPAGPAARTPGLLTLLTQVCPDSGFFIHRWR